MERYEKIVAYIEDPPGAMEIAVPHNRSVGPALDVVDTLVVDLAGGVVSDGRVGELQVQSPANWRQVRCPQGA